MLALPVGIPPGLETVEESHRVSVRRKLRHHPFLCRQTHPLAQAGVRGKLPDPLRSSAEQFITLTMRSWWFTTVSETLDTFTFESLWRCRPEA
jgi:hypothetical protein